MRAVSIADVEAQEATSGYFVGRVRTQAIIGSREDELRVVAVHFTPGATSVFHAHTADHVLYVTEGIGVVVTEDDELTVAPGTAVHIPAGERHRHGATGQSAASLIAIMPPGETVF